MDRVASGVLLIAAGIIWIVWYRRLSGQERDSLTGRLFGPAGTPLAPVASSSGGGADLSPGGVGASSSGGGTSLPSHQPTAAERFNKVLEETRNAWKIAFPGVPLPGGDIKPLPVRGAGGG